MGEIEAALQSIPNIKQAVVLVRELKIGSRSLVAFFVPYQKYLNPSEIASALKDKLPSYMIPSDFIQLDAFPITRNGKVDRKRLTALSIVSPAGQAVQSNSKTEGAIAKIYTEILGLAHVDVTSSFFSLGGTSMETLTLQRELLNQLGAEVRMPDLFTFVTPRSLAEHIDSKLVSKEPSGNVQLSAAIERARTQKVARRRIGAHRGGGASITTQQQLKKPQ